MAITGIMFLIAFGLIFLRIPISVAMGVAGFWGFGYVIGWPQAMIMVANTAQSTVMKDSFVVIPLFILMGNLVAGAGVSTELFRAAQAFLSGRRGGLASATIAASAGFASICGSSVATVVTMGRVAVPPMREFRYNDQLATATIAAGATLGILIPPSVLLIIYGVITGTHVGKLYAAGLVPGILGIVLYLAAVRWVVFRNPDFAPQTQRVGWSDRAKACIGVWPALVLFVVVIGGIYSGIFTAVEASGIGALGALTIAVAGRQTSLAQLHEIFLSSAKTTAVLFALLIGAFAFTEGLNISGAHHAVLTLVNDLGLSPAMVIFTMCIVYIIMGMFVDTGSMVLLTVPLFFPIVTGLGFDPVWFGILVVVLAELGLITPPIGLNLFVMKSVVPDVPMGHIIKGIVPFILVDVLRIILIAAVPAISLFLPNLLFG